MMALKGIRVIEMAGLAPGPFCGLILSDFGARVIRVERPESKTFALDRLTRGKESIVIDLNKNKGQSLFLDLCGRSDVLIDTFRPGTMEKLKVGPEEVLQRNAQLIYARLSGYGQEGSFSNKPGHDINFLALSGVLSRLGGKSLNPQSGQNLLGDFGGGGLMCAFGILAALLERNVSAKGQVLDANITDGSSYLCTWLWRAKDMPFWGEKRGCGFFDGGLSNYKTYGCKDGKYLAVGCLEMPFLQRLAKGLDLERELDEAGVQSFMSRDLSDVFIKRTRDQWVEHFDGLDTCVSPVLDLDEAPHHPHHQQRNSFISPEKHYSQANCPTKSEDAFIPFAEEETKKECNEKDIQWEPRPSPRMSRTPADIDNKMLEPSHAGQDSIKILQEMAYTNQDIQALLNQGIIELPEQ